MDELVSVAEDRHARGGVAVHAWGELAPRLMADLVALERRVHQASPHYDDAPWQAEHFARALPGKDELSLVATVHDKPVGFLVASRMPSGVHVHRLAVDADHWGHGIASLMLARLLAASAGVVTLHCDPENERALALYRRAGLRLAGSTSAGRLLLSTKPIPRTEELTVWYVVTAAGMHSGHAAHVPGLVGAMARLSRTSAIRYGHREDLPLFRFRPGWFLAFARLLVRARRERVDVIFVRIHWRLAALLWLAGRLGGGWRVALWSSGGPGFLPGVRQGVRDRLVRTLHRTVLRHLVDAVVTGPPKLLAEYADRYRLRPDHLLLAGNDVNVDRWCAAAAGEPELASLETVQRWLSAPYRFLYVHGLDRIRGADLLPELLAGLRREVAGAQLLALGDGPLREALGTHPLLLAGSVPNEAAAWAMSQAHCLLVPSRQEGFPRVLLEAMALGLPCVSFDVGGCREILGDTPEDYVAPPYDVDRLVELAARAAHRRVLDGPPLALAQRAAAFDTEPVAAALVATLRSLRSHGTTAASWLSRSLWRPVFQSRSL